MAIKIEESDSQKEGRCQGCGRLDVDETSGAAEFPAYPVAVVSLSPKDKGVETRIRVCANCRTELKEKL